MTDGHDIVWFRLGLETSNLHSASDPQATSTAVTATSVAQSASILADHPSQTQSVPQGSSQTATDDSETQLSEAKSASTVSAGKHSGRPGAEKPTGNPEASQLRGRRKKKQRTTLDKRTSNANCPLSTQVVITNKRTSNTQASRHLVRKMGGSQPVRGPATHIHTHTIMGMAHLPIGSGYVVPP